MNIVPKSRKSMCENGNETKPPFFSNHSILFSKGIGLFVWNYSNYNWSKSSTTLQSPILIILHYITYRPEKGHSGQAFSSPHGSEKWWKLLLFSSADSSQTDLQDISQNGIPGVCWEHVKLIDFTTKTTAICSSWLQWIYTIAISPISIITHRLYRKFIFPLVAQCSCSYFGCFPQWHLSYCPQNC